MTKGEDALERLMSLVREDISSCNTLIVDRMQSPVALIPQLAAHIVAAGGKRLRPLLTLAAARLCGYPSRAMAGGTWRWPPASSSSTPRRCCTTTWWTRARCGAARRAPTRCSATSPPSWWGTSCSPAPSS
jgi:geranylgeranyl pyrophosphate synthase